MIKKDLLLLANERLQVRIEELTKQVSELKDTNSEQTLTIKNLTLDKNDLITKIKYKEKIITQYQNSNPVPTKANLVHNAKIIKSIKRKGKKNDNKRKKSIYGILKNKYRYNLSQAEIKFLESINHSNAITPKQQSWYNGIKERGK